MADVMSLMVVVASVPGLLLITGLLLLLVLFTRVWGTQGRYGKTVGVIGTVLGAGALIGGMHTGVIAASVEAGAYWLSALFFVPLSIGVLVLGAAYRDTVHRLYGGDVT